MTPRRVQILRVAGNPNYWKPGQYGYVMGENLSRGRRYEVFPMDRSSGACEPGEVCYLVSKSSHGRGGALWFTSSALRFTGGVRR